MPALDQVDAMEAGEAGPSSRRGSDPEPVTDALMVSGAGELGGAQMAGSMAPLPPRRAQRRLGLRLRRLRVAAMRRLLK